VRKAAILAQNAASKLDTQPASSRFGVISFFGLRILQLRSRVSRVCQELATGLKPQERPSDCEHIILRVAETPPFRTRAGFSFSFVINRLLTFPATVEWVTRSPRRSCDNFSRPAGKIVILHRRPWRSGASTAHP
jgi:hypothetical protein